MFTYHLYENSYKKILNNLGIDVKRLHPECKNQLTFDDIYKLKIENDPIIFDIGAIKVNQLIDLGKFSQKV